MAPAFLSVFLTHSTLSEKRFILTVAILYGLVTPSLIGMAVWFKTPRLLCRPQNSESDYVACYEKDFCHSQVELSIKVAEDSSPSLSATMGFLCDIEKKALLKTYFFGGILGCLANIFLPLSAKKRKSAIVLFGFLHSLANFSVIFQYESMEILHLSFGLVAFSLMIFYANCPLLINEAFVGDMAKAAVTIVQIGWGIVGLSYVCWSYLVNADFYQCFTFVGFMTFLTSLHLMLQKQPKVHEQLSTNVTKMFFIIF